jgi:hypothetical protein
MTKKLAALALLIVFAVTAAFAQVPFLGGLERSLGTPLRRAQTEWKPVFTSGGVA